MQKSALSTIFREEITRGLIFGGTFFIIVIATMSGVAHAASGGLFGDILAKILGIDPANLSTYLQNGGDGTVANASKLGGTPATDFQKVVPGQSCGGGQCIYGFDTSGNILCR